MSAVRFHKVVGSLPGALEANSVYFLRTGAGFSIHITNDLGKVEAYNLNTSSVAPESSAYWDFIYDGKCRPGRCHHLPHTGLVTLNDV